MKKPILYYNDPADADAVEAAIKDYLFKHTDPDGWAMAKMIERIRTAEQELEDLGYDQAAWDADVWVPKGTKYIP